MSSGIEPTRLTGGIGVGVSTGVTERGRVGDGGGIGELAPVGWQLRGLRSFQSKR